MFNKFNITDQDVVSSGYTWSGSEILTKSVPRNVLKNRSAENALSEVYCLNLFHPNIP